MKILKYKKMANGKYKLSLDNNMDLLLYEDVILKYDLLLTKTIDDMDLINNYNMECDCYYVALKSLNNRFKSVYELESFLISKEYPKDLIDKAVDKLLKQGYLNDRSFAKGFINNQIITTNKGPNKIKSELVKRKVEGLIIDEELDAFTIDIQEEKIRKVIDRLIKSNRNRGGVVLKQKIYNDLYNLGYDSSIINKCLGEYEFGNDGEIAKREYEKLYKRLSRKYSGTELEFKIKEKLFQKGLYYDD